MKNCSFCSVVLLLTTVVIFLGGSEISFNILLNVHGKSVNIVEFQNIIQSNNNLLWTTSTTLISSNSSILVLALNNNNEQNKKLISVDDLNNQVLHVYAPVGEEAMWESIMSIIVEMWSIRPKRIVYTDELYCDCIHGNPFLDSGTIQFLILSDKILPTAIRNLRDNYKLSRQAKFSDFQVMDLAPLEIQYENQTNSQEINEFLQDSISTCFKFMNSSQIPKIGKEYQKHDLCWLRNDLKILGISQFPTFQSHFQRKFNFLLSFNSTTIQQVYNSLSQQLALNYSTTTSATTSTISTTSQLLDSSYYECVNSNCLLEPPTVELYLNIFIICQCLVFMGVVWMFRNKKSMRIRLILPYVGPLLIILRAVVHLEFFSRMCPVLYASLSSIILVNMTLIYGCTVFRYLYLRNLFNLVQKSNQFNIRWLKLLATKRFGVLISVIVCTVVSVAILCLWPLYLHYFNDNTLRTARNLTGFVVFIPMILLSFTFSICDLISNRKCIRKHGFFYYLFFDDPFYVKLDLLFLFVIPFFNIPFILPIREPIIDYVSFTGIITPVLMVLGGNTMLVECVKMIRFHRRSQQMKQEESELEQLLDNANIFKLMKKYCKKECSIENILLFEKVQKMCKMSTNDHSLVLSELRIIEEDFLRNSYSKYAVNVSFNTKRSFYEWYDKLLWMDNSNSSTATTTTAGGESLNYSDCSSVGGRTSEAGLVSQGNTATSTGGGGSGNRGTTIGSQLHAIIFPDLLMNLMDTFQRLQQTNEYIKLKSVMEIQKEVMVNNELN